jgi:AcrR family transcriptional regulator
LETEIPLSRKERERLLRQGDILNAARKVFSERGFKNATLDEIAVLAEFGKGTIYNYFKSKEELFVSIIVSGIHRFQRFVEEAVVNQISPREKIEAYIDATFEFFKNNRQIFSILVLERTTLARSLNDDLFSQFCAEEAGLLSYLARLIAEGAKKKAFKKLDSEKIAEMLFGLIHSVFVRAVMQPESYDLDGNIAVIKNIFFEGIALNGQK